MNIIKIGEIRKWKRDTNNEHFKVEEYKSFFVNEHYYIIRYLTDGRIQNVAESDLLDRSVISNIYDGENV